MNPLHLSVGIMWASVKFFCNLFILNILAYLQCLCHGIYINPDYVFGFRWCQEKKPQDLIAINKDRRRYVLAAI